jgi:hypothetical protein
MIKITKEQLKELYVKGVCYTEDTIKVVDDDEDWTLSEQEEPQLSGTKFNALFIEDIKKCRDLILEDIELRGLCCPFAVREVINEIINKRFGDLK